MKLDPASIVRQYCISPDPAHGFKILEKYKDDFEGFVYLSENITRKKYYIGKKSFKIKKTLPPLKGKQRKRIKYIDSDWREYYGSSPKLQEDLKNGDLFERYPVWLCPSKSWLSYMETYCIMFENAIINPDYYNDNLGMGIRVNGVHLMNDKLKLKNRGIKI